MISSSQKSVSSSLPRTEAIHNDLETIVKKVNRTFRFRATEVQVLYDWIAEEELRDAAFDRMVERVVLNRAKGDRVIVPDRTALPYIFGAPFRPPSPFGCRFFPKKIGDVITKL